MQQDRVKMLMQICAIERNRILHLERSLLSSSRSLQPPQALDKAKQTREIPFKMPQNTRLKNVSIIYFNGKNCEFKRNENLEIERIGRSETGEGGRGGGIRKINLKEDQKYLELESDSWIILPAFADLCADFTSNKSSTTAARDIQKLIKDKWAFGVGSTVALLPDGLEMSASNCDSDVLESLVQFASPSSTSSSKISSSLWNKEKTITVDFLDDGVYSFNHHAVTVSAFPNPEAGYVYGSGNPNEQSMSPWMYALSKGPKQDFKRTLFEMTRSLDECASPSSSSKASTSNSDDSIYLSTAMVLKIEPSWDLSSCGKLPKSCTLLFLLINPTDSILKSIFMHGGNSNKVSALYSAKGALLYSCQEWKNVLQQASMEKYYTQENDKSIAISNNGNGHHHQQHIFNTIPESIEAFSMCIILNLSYMPLTLLFSICRTRRIFGGSGQ